MLPKLLFRNIEGRKFTAVHQPHCLIVQTGKGAKVHVVLPRIHLTLALF